MCFAEGIPECVEWIQLNFLYPGKIFLEYYFQMKQCYLLEMNTNAVNMFSLEINKKIKCSCKNTLCRYFTSHFLDVVLKTVHCHHPWRFWKALPEILWRTKLLRIMANFEGGGGAKKKTDQKTN